MIDLTKKKARWIWLNPEKYPNSQKNTQRALLEDCHQALVTLFACFQTYMGKKG